MGRTTAAEIEATEHAGAMWLQLEATDGFKLFGAVRESFAPRRRDLDSRVAAIPLGPPTRQEVVHQERGMRARVEFVLELSGTIIPH
jgi:hypothetical protein